MTPPASAAARSVHPSTRRAGRGAARHPRRVSGPARPSALAAAVALPSPGIALPRERPSRPSAPARSRPARPARRRAAEAPGLALRAIDKFDGLSGSALFDRLIRGRVWIGLLAFSLIGIVAMQLLVLELNTGIGRTLQREALLQRQNAQMGIEDSASTAGDRIEPLAGSAGMVIAAPTALHFLGVGVSDVRRAADVLATAVQAPGNSPRESTPGGSQGTAGSAGLIASATAPVGESGSSAGAAGSAPSWTGREGGSSSSSGPSQSTSGTSPGSGAPGSVSGAGPASGASAPVSSAGAGASAGGASATPSGAATAAGSGESGPGGGTQAGPQG